uniref:Basic tail secreted protein n=1 Tax=Rhipicephalus appendiculatus TaxID=34631 RepID=A0A131Z511_RHIAP
MLAIALSALLLPLVLGESYVEQGECNGTVTNPGKPVRSCNFWCKVDNDWEKKYFPANTKCWYDDARNGTCVDTGDGKTGCRPNEEGVDHQQPHNEGTDENNVEEQTTKSPKRNDKDKNKKKKKKNKKERNSTSTAKPTKKIKKQKKTPTTPAVEW